MTAVPLLGFLIGALVSLMCAVVGGWIVSRIAPDLDRAAKCGIGGLVGVGVLGTLTFFQGVVGIPSFELIALGQIGAAFLLLLPHVFRFARAFRMPSGLGFIVAATIFLLLFLRLFSALSPSDGSDWDSISHQMAMSKIWLESGRIGVISFMDHSNIPATINCAYIPLLALGDQYAVKTLIWFCALFALVAVAGLARMRYGPNAAWWAALSLASVPVFMWEAGTAYIDIPNGCYSGAAVVFSCLWLADRRKQWLILSGLMLGFALASKYTAFQYALGITLMMLLVGTARRDMLTHAKSLGLILIMGAVFVAPWLIRNVINTGNPTYPFFYSVFGGTNWNAEAEHAYKMEQRRFGIGQTDTGKDWIALPGSITALALQPDKQINNAAIWGAVGPMFVFGIFVWLLAARGGSFEVGIVLATVITLCTWFFLTQQSRYIIGLAFPISILLGGAVPNLSLAGKLVAIGVSAQALWSLFLFSPYVLPVAEQARVVLGVDRPDHYLRSRFSFFRVSEAINRMGKTERVKVALYDEVRGFYLDVPYLWANPNHHTLIRYDEITTGEQLVGQMRELQVTHVYVNCSLEVLPEQLAEQMTAALLGDETALPANTDEWRKHLANAVAAGWLTPIEDESLGRTRFLFRIRD